MRGEINNAAGVGATDLEVDGLGVEALLHLERLEVDLFADGQLRPFSEQGRGLGVRRRAVW